MMYGFGDDNPAPDTINVMEELLVEHIIDIVSPRKPTINAFHTSRLELRAF